MKSTPKFIACLIICFGAAVVGGLFTEKSVNTWYAQLSKPWFSPPNWVFAPVWCFLYLLMAVSFYLIWVSDKQKHKSVAMVAFVGQLLINITWSAVFFGLHSPAGGLLVIIILIVAISCTMFFFRRVSTSVVSLLIPYLAWVCFAGYLNYHLWILNR